MKIAVIIPAAGLGKRFHEAGGGSASSAKIELDLAGRPIFLRAVELFLNRPEVAQILLAVNPQRLDDFKFRHGDKLGFHGVMVVPGGKIERWETVLNALKHVKDDITHVAVHDAARPMASRKLIDRVFEAAKQYPAVIPGLPVSATLKRVVADEANVKDRADALDAILGSAGKPSLRVQRVIQTVDRNQLMEAQTPQVFQVELLRRAYARLTDGTAQGHGITDDAGLVELLGETVYVVEGESFNLKITRPDDLQFAQACLESLEQKKAAELGRKRLFQDDDE